MVFFLSMKGKITSGTTAIESLSVKREVGVPTRKGFGDGGYGDWEIGRVGWKGQN